MADKISQTFTLYVGLTDSEDKLETLKLPNPKSNLNESQIRSAIGYLTDTIGAYDKYGVAFSSTQITTAYTDNVKKIELDLT